MNDKQQELILTVMDMISDTLDNYKKDQHHAPAAWLLENWWNTLECVLASPTFFLSLDHDEAPGSL